MRSKKPAKDRYLKPEVARLEIVPCPCEGLIKELAEHVLLDYQLDEQSMLLLQGGAHEKQHLGLLQTTHGPNCSNTKQTLEAQIRWFAGEDELLDHLTSPSQPIPTGVAAKFETALLCFLENRRLLNSVSPSLVLTGASSQECP